MSGDQYKEQFISEAKDHLNSINDHLLKFEKDPSNEEAIHDLFRSFHTLKGNASTMGFTRYSELAHHLEDLLDKIRNKQIEGDSELLDVLFEGADSLENGLNSISEGRSEEIDDSEILEKIKKIMSSAGIKKKEKSEQKLEIELTKDEKKRIDELRENNNVLKISLEFEDDSTLKLAKALLAIRSIEGSCEFVKLFPPKEEIKNGDFGTEILMVVVSKKNKDEFEDLFKTITGLKSHEISHFDESIKSGDTKNSQSSQDSSNESEKTASKKPIPDSKEVDKAKIAKQQQEAMSKQMQSVKIDIKSLDNLMDLVGELLISKVRLEQYAKNSTDKDFNSVVDNLTRMTIDIQDEVMKQRMIPIGNIFNRFPRMVRDLAKKENKKVNLIIEGQ
ncbi:MAG: Hpt domain-containing protein, partial [Nanoarchaeota archaeon]